MPRLQKLHFHRLLLLYIGDVCRNRLEPFQYSWYTKSFALENSSELNSFISQLTFEASFLRTSLRPLFIGFFVLFGVVIFYPRKRANSSEIKNFCSELNLKSVELMLFCSELNICISEPINPILPIMPIFPIKKYLKKSKIKKSRYIVITKSPAKVHSAPNDHKKSLIISLFQ